MRAARFLPTILSINLPPRPPRRSLPRPRFVSSWFRGRGRERARERARARLGLWSRCAILLLGMSLLDRSALAATVELVVDTTQTIGEIDLTRYALGQGGLSEKPMIAAHVDQLARLQPRTIRLFVQEYFHLYPKPGRYHWDTLDRSIEAILATGARPLLCLCFKPRVLFPKIEQDVV